VTGSQPRLGRHDDVSFAADLAIDGVSEHGLVKGNAISSPTVFVGFGTDWRSVLEAYGDANVASELAARLHGLAITGANQLFDRWPRNKLVGSIGSMQTNAWIIPITEAAPSVFFRLARP